MFDGRCDAFGYGGQVIPIKATRRTFVVTFLGLAVLAGVSATVLFYPGGLYNFACGQFDLPEYEKAYGFTYAAVAVLRPDGSTRLVGGISEVDPKGAFARSGIRAGDIPKVHHGIGDFCGDIASAEESDRHWIEVFNAYDEKSGKEPRREVLLQLRK